MLTKKPFLFYMFLIKFRNKYSNQAISKIALLTCISLLGSCQTPYKENGYYFGGYDDTVIDAHTAVVSFDGNYFTKQKTAEKYVLYRAAQVTLRSGYDYFIVTSGTSKPISSDAQSAPQLMKIAQSTPHGSVAVIKMFKGMKPAGMSNAFDARELLALLGPGTY